MVSSPQAKSREAPSSEVVNIHGNLEKVRKKLLDLTRNNRLLNFRHGKKTLRIVDEVLNRIHLRLVSSGEYIFSPVPLPKPRDYAPEELEKYKNKKVDAYIHAQKLGIRAGYDLVEAKTTGEERHEDNYLQTLLYPEDLDITLRRIVSDARTAQEESGVNMLFLCLGFLSWYESDDSEVENLAPLVMMPVAIERDSIDRNTGYPKYKLTYTGEDIWDNICLREKLLSEWALNLPELSDFEEIEDYYSAVGNLLKASKPRWSIKRYGSIGILSFGKMLMYLDLNPERWPAEDNLIDHDIISKLFKGAERTTAPAAASEYDIDTDKTLPNVPLIMDCDSSQHSAIIDVLNGKNLVIEGPPGTGKSQTITNMIASSLEKGKTVLFISEKLAALEVVRRRLDNSGLGDFCLELHSHKTQKKELLEDIKRRLAIRNSRKLRHPQDLDDHIRDLERKRSRLLAYTKELHTPLNTFAETPYQIFWKQEYYRQEISDIQGEIEELSNFPKPHVYSQADYKDAIYAIKELSRALEDFDTSEAQNAIKFWRGLDLFEIEFYHQDILLKLLTKIQEISETCLSHVQQFSKITELEGVDCFEFVQLAKKIEKLTGDYKEVWAENLSLCTNSANTKSLENLSAKISECKKLFGKLQKDPLQNQIAEDKRSNLTKAYHTLQELEVGLSSATHKEIRQQLKTITDLVNSINNRRDILNSLTDLFDLRDEELSLSDIKLLFEIADYCAGIKKDIIEARSDGMEKPILIDQLVEIRRRCEDFSALKAAFSDFYSFDETTELQCLDDAIESLENQSLLRIFDSEWRNKNKSIKTLAKQPKKKTKQAMINDLRQIRSALNGLPEFLASNILAELKTRYYKGLDTDFSFFERMTAYYAELRNKCLLNRKIGHRLYQTAKTKDFSTYEWVQLNNYEIKKYLADVESLVSSFSKIARIHLTNLIDSGASYKAFLKAVKDFTDATNIVLSDIPAQLDDISFEQAMDFLTNYDELEKQKIAILDSELFSKFFNQENYLEDEGLSNLDAYLTYGNALKQLIPQKFHEALLNNDHKNRVLELASIKNQFEELQECRKKFYGLVKELGIAENGFDHIASDVVSTPVLKDLVTKLKQLKSAMPYFDRWCAVLNARKQLKQLEILNFIKSLESINLRSADYERTFRYIFYRSLIMVVLNENSGLSKYTRNVLDNLRKDFADVDSQIIQLNRQKIASILNQRHVPYGNSSGSVKNYTELALLEREIEKQRKHIPIRSLVNRAGKALLALKPCFMMGPLSVAQYLQPGIIKFDLIIMDEASQVKPEEAIGAISRGGQIVVVGDSNQLPPTSFFDKMQDDNDTEEESALDNTESILDVCKFLYQPNRRLRWHYRSQHHSLISFSNKHFYDNDLIIFPSPTQQSATFGVSYHHVHDGVYTSRSNLIEAQNLIDDLCKSVQQNPTSSYGIVTLNAVQKDLIEDLIERKRKADPLFEAFLTENKSALEPLFVKNLENVQGDERDIIYISTTFGKDADGVLKQNFGPINGANGWRRLNVLFTRAKQQIRVFSSMHPEDIIADEKSARGTHVLKNYLKFAMSGIDEAAIQTGKEPDSMFEVAVKNMLYAKGYEVVPQLGVAGYFIDLVVKHPLRSDFVMAIECDGAAYHSAKSARDRDRLREENLRKLGWNHIHRIWSTDWFRNRKREEERLFAALERAIQESDEAYEQSKQGSLPSLDLF